MVSELLHHAVFAGMLAPWGKEASAAERTVFVVALLVVWWGGLRWSARRIRAGLSRTKLDPERQRLLAFVFNGLAWALAAQLLFGVLDVPSLVVTIGGGFALVLMGLAGSFAPALSDLAAGLLLRSDGDLHVGAHIRFHGIEGTIDAVEIRKIKIKDARGRVHVVPSRLLDQEIFVVLGVEDHAQDFGGRRAPSALHAARSDRPEGPKRQ